MKRRYRTGGQAWVRERNLAIMLNYLWEAGGPVSRTHLVEISGLNKSTVGSLLAQLQSWGLVKESGMSGPRPGRPGVLIDLNPDAGRVIGAEIGVDYISVVVTDLKANVVWCRKVDTNSGSAQQEQILSQTESLIQESLAQAVTGNSRLFGIGVGVPGLVDHATGTLLFAPNLKWRNLPLREMWRKRFGTLVVVENDARAAAVGEWMLGAARQVENFIYLSAGVGLGGGVMINGRLYGGIGGFAGEVGHMTLEPDGPRCNCGNRGCWEVLVGPTAIVGRVRQAAQAGQAPVVLGLCRGDVNAIKMEHVLQAAAQNEPAVIAAFQEAGRYLGIGIANLVNAFNPSLVVLGGVLSLAAPYILPRAQQEIDRRALDAARAGVRVTVSAFKFDACVMGGTALILREILNNPAAWQPKGAPVEEHQIPASAL
jgi:glucokinase-like ROK family protein